MRVGRRYLNESSSRGRSRAVSLWFRDLVGKRLAVSAARAASPRSLSYRNAKLASYLTNLPNQQPPDRLSAGRLATSARVPHWVSRSLPHFSISFPCSSYRHTCRFAFGNVARASLCPQAPRCSQQFWANTRNTGVNVNLLQLAWRSLLPLQLYCKDRTKPIGSRAGKLGTQIDSLLLSVSSEYLFSPARAS